MAFAAMSIGGVVFSAPLLAAGLSMLAAGWWLRRWSARHSLRRLAMDSAKNMAFGAAKGAASGAKQAAIDGARQGMAGARGAATGAAGQALRSGAMPDAAGIVRDAKAHGLAKAQEIAAAGTRGAMAHVPGELGDKLQQFQGAASNTDRAKLVAGTAVRGYLATFVGLAGLVSGLAGLAVTTLAFVWK